jgi:ligand-binding SRPBCC domain-containing protein
MRIRFVTTVMAPYKVVTKGFNRKLLEYLLPPFSFIRRYEGQQPGDIIDLRLRVPFTTNWTVIIKDSWHSFKEYGFADRGLRVPMGIKYWQHSHRVVTRNDDSSFIIDDIEYETSYIILDYILYIPLFLSFYRRKFLYKKYFEKIIIIR